MFFYVLWCFFMSYDVLLCPMMFYVLGAFLVSFCRSVPPVIFLVGLWYIPFPKRFMCNKMLMDISRFLHLMFNRGTLSKSWDMSYEALSVKWGPNEDHYSHLVLMCEDQVLKLRPLSWSSLHSLRSKKEFRLPARYGKTEVRGQWSLVTSSWFIYISLRLSTKITWTGLQEPYWDHYMFFSLMLFSKQQPIYLCSPHSTVPPLLDSSHSIVSQGCHQFLLWWLSWIEPAFPWNGRDDISGCTALRETFKNPNHGFLPWWGGVPSFAVIFFP